MGLEEDLVSGSCSYDIDSSWFWWSLYTGLPALVVGIIGCIGARKFLSDRDVKDKDKGEDEARRNECTGEGAPGEDHEEISESTEEKEHCHYGIDDWNKRMYHMDRPAGADNSGNSCYMNAALQFMLAVRPIMFTYRHLFKVYKREEPFNSYLVALVADLTGKTLDRSTGYNSRSWSRYGKQDAAHKFREIAGRDHEAFSGYGQEDSMEYFLHLLLKIEQNFPDSLSELNPCKKMKIELCERICRGEEKSYVKREEFVISCPLAEGPKPSEEIAEDFEWISDTEVVTPDGKTDTLDPLDGIGNKVDPGNDDSAVAKKMPGITLEAKHDTSVGSTAESSGSIADVPECQTEEAEAKNNEDKVDELNPQDNIGSKGETDNGDDSAVAEERPGIAVEQDHDDINRLKPAAGGLPGGGIRDESAVVEEKLDTDVEQKTISDLDNSQQNQTNGDDAHVDTDIINDKSTPVDDVNNEEGPCTNTYSDNSSMAEGKPGIAVGSGDIGAGDDMNLQSTVVGGAVVDDGGSGANLKDGHFYTEDNLGENKFLGNCFSDAATKGVGNISSATSDMDMGNGQAEKSAESTNNHSDIEDMDTDHQYNNTSTAAENDPVVMVEQIDDPETCDPVMTSENGADNTADAEAMEVDVSPAETKQQVTGEENIGEIGYHDNDEDVTDKDITTSFSVTTPGHSYGDEVESASTNTTAELIGSRDADEDVTDKDKDITTSSSVTTPGHSYGDEVKSASTNTTAELIGNKQNTQPETDGVSAETMSSSVVKPSLEEVEVSRMEPFMGQSKTSTRPTTTVKSGGRVKKKQPSSTTTSYHGYPQEKGYNLVDCIRKFMAEEEVLSRSTSRITKTSRVAYLPEYVVIQPRIFVLNNYGRPEKLRVKINAPDEIDFKEWICGEDWKKNCEQSFQENTESVFSLKAFVTHYGSSPRSGHYICHVKYDQQWYEYNDNCVSKATNPPKENGYFYLYERIDVKNAFETGTDV